jgi:UDP-glucose 4-epimerase
MNLVVTGGAGYIGGTEATLLVRAGHCVTVVDNFCHSRRDALPQGVALVEADVADRTTMENLLRAEKPDGVLHFASLIEAGESMLYPEKYFRNNTAATLALLEAMLATDVRRIVFSSTAAVCGEPERVPIDCRFANYLAHFCANYVAHSCMWTSFPPFRKRRVSSRCVASSCCGHISKGCDRYVPWLLKLQFPIEQP